MENTESKLKFEGFSKGDKIKAYDHQPFRDEQGQLKRPEKYVKGVVMGVVSRRGAKWYEITCTDDSVFHGKHTRVGETVFVPLDMGAFDYDERIQKVG